jgi:hypothetical protein
MRRQRHRATRTECIAERFSNGFADKGQSQKGDQRTRACLPVHADGGRRDQQECRRNQRHGQRVSFRAQAGQGLSWRLDGKLFATADADFAWTPQAGMHRLELIDRHDRAIASTRFEVR